MELPGFFKEKSTEQELPLILQPQPVVKPEIFGNYAVIKGFADNKFPLLTTDVELIEKFRNSPVQYQYSHHQRNYDNDLHKVRFSFACFRSLRSEFGLTRVLDEKGFRQDKIACRV
jgi:hypothetical protein